VRLVTYRDNGIRNAVGRAGVLTDEGVIDINGANSGCQETCSGSSRAVRITSTGCGASLEGTRNARSTRSTLLARSRAPRRSSASASNYADHAAEAGRALPRWPSVSSKRPRPSSVRATRSCARRRRAA